jgi:hypothetical protein
LFGLLNILVFNGLSLLTIYTHFKSKRAALRSI